MQELDSIKSGKRSMSGLPRGGSSTNLANGKSLTSKLDSHIKNIENERDYFKQEVDTLQKLLKTAQHDYKLTSMTNYYSSHKSPISQTRRRSSSAHRSRKETDRSPSKRVASKSRSPSTNHNPINGTRCSVCAGPAGASLSSSSSAMPTNIETVSSRAVHTSRSPSRVTTNITLNNNSNEEIKQLRRERDELQSLLDKFERHMAEVDLIILQKLIKFILNEIFF